MNIVKCENKHFYDRDKTVVCPKCLAQFKEINLDTPEQITTETFAPIETIPPETTGIADCLEVIKQVNKNINEISGMPSPPLCIDCHYIATSFDKDFTKFRCLHPDNHQGKNLVDGSNVYLYEFCWQLRSGQARHPQACCDRQGKGFKQRTPPPVMSVDAPASNVTSIGPRKIPKLSATDLDNL